jgi:hypothetical protein
VHAWANAARGNGAHSPAPRAPAPSADALKTLQALGGLTGTTVTLATRAGPRLEGVVGGTAPEDGVPGVSLKDARDVLVPGAPIKDRVFVPAAHIASWASGPADAKPTAPNGNDSECRPGAVRPTLDLSPLSIQDRRRYLL